ncbi:hypothetical protein ACFJ6A_000738 [Vibrio vulnificus]
MISDSITIFDANCKCCKSYYLNSGVLEKTDYDQIYKCVFTPVRITSIDDLHKLISKLATKNKMGIVNATPIKRTSERVRRLINLCNKTGDSPTLKGFDHHWVCVDYDKDEIPTDVSVKDAPEWVINNLMPEWLRESSYVYQFSNSALLCGNGAGKLHFWFMFEKPMNKETLDILFNGYPVDFAAFRSNQVLYTANPIIDLELDDPLENKRIGLIRKGQDVVTPPTVKVPKKKAFKVSTGQSSTTSAEDEKMLKFCGMESVNIMVELGKSYHYDDLIKVGSSLLRCGLDIHDVMMVCTKLQSPASKTPIASVRTAITSPNGKKTGVPWLLEQCSISMRDLKKRVVKKYYKRPTAVMPSLNQ